MTGAPLREITSMHEPTLTELFEALECSSDEENWYERNPEITITQDELPKNSFTAVIVLDYKEVSA